jgi:hypothetical protein
VESIKALNVRTASLKEKCGRLIMILLVLSAILKKVASGTILDIVLDIIWRKLKLKGEKLKLNPIWEPIRIAAKN